MAGYRTRNFYDPENRVNTSDGILHVANHVHDPRKPLVDANGNKIAKVDVYLPKDTMDPGERSYAEYLLTHPHSDVTVHFTAEDLSKHK